MTIEKPNSLHVSKICVQYNPIHFFLLKSDSGCALEFFFFAFSIRFSLSLSFNVGFVRGVPQWRMFRTKREKEKRIWIFFHFIYFLPPNGDSNFDLTFQHFNDSTYAQNPAFEQLRFHIIWFFTFYLFYFFCILLFVLKLQYSKIFILLTIIFQLSNLSFTSILYGKIIQ